MRSGRTLTPPGPVRSTGNSVPLPPRLIREHRTRGGPLPERFRADAEADAIERCAATVLVSSTRALPRRRRGGRDRRSRDALHVEGLAVCEAQGGTSCSEGAALDSSSRCRATTGARLLYPGASRRMPRRARSRVARGRASREAPSIEGLAVCEAPGDRVLRRERAAIGGLHASVEDDELRRARIDRALGCVVDRDRAEHVLPASRVPHAVVREADRVLGALAQRARGRRQPE